MCPSKGDGEVLGCPPRARVSSEEPWGQTCPQEVRERNSRLFWPTEDLGVGFLKLHQKEFLFFIQTLSSPLSPRSRGQLNSLSGPCRTWVQGHRPWDCSVPTSVDLIRPRSGGRPMVPGGAETTGTLTRAAARLLLPSLRPGVLAGAHTDHGIREPPLCHSSTALLAEQ